MVSWLTRKWEEWDLLCVGSFLLSFFEFFSKANFQCILDVWWTTRVVHLEISTPEFFILYFLRKELWVLSRNGKRGISRNVLVFCYFYNVICHKFCNLTKWAFCDFYQDFVNILWFKFVVIKPDFHVWSFSSASPSCLESAADFSKSLSKSGLLLKSQFSDSFSNAVMSNSKGFVRLCQRCHKIFTNIFHENLENEWSGQFEELLL